MTQKFTLTLSAKPHATPAIIRLRKLLKLALRAFALECIEVKEIPQPQPPATPVKDQ